jgi:hypothetical protein
MPVDDGDHWYPCATSRSRWTGRRTPARPHGAAEVEGLPPMDPRAGPGGVFPLRRRETGNRKPTTSGDFFSRGRGAPRRMTHCRKGKRGRPQWRPSKAERAKVRTLIGMGVSLRDSAAIVGVTAPTLRRHCAHELATARGEADAAVLLSLYKAATNPERPNVRAMKLWLALRGWHEVEAPGAARSPAAARPPAEGKKQRQRETAEQIAKSSRFAPSQPPRLVVVTDGVAEVTSADDYPKP